jgi:CubicO group peptidase (beta-lactamase class C family)
MEKNTKFSPTLIFWLIFFYLLSFQFDSFVLGDEKKNDKIKKIDKILTFYESAGKVNAAVLVAEKGKVIYKKAFGYADFEKKIPNETDSKFYIYSLTKPFTAVLVMQLVEEGKMKLAGKISEYLPYYRKDIGDKVTIHHLLTHTHGIPETDVSDLPGRVPYSVEEFVTKYLSGDLEFEPGSQFKYSGLPGYAILGAIIEKVTGKTFKEVLEEKILKPLDMKNTGFIETGKRHEKETVRYSRLSTFEFKKRTGDFVNIHFNGSSSMYSTVDDLYKFSQALIFEQLLSKESKDLMFKPHILAKHDNHYGYGWYLGEQYFMKVKRSFYLHGGGNAAFFFQVPKDNVVFIYLTNLAVYDFLTVIAINSEIIRILYDFPYLPFPKNYCYINLYRVMKEKGIEAALKHYRFLKKNHADKYAFSEDEFIYLGKFLLDKGKIKETIEICKLALESNPKSWKAFHYSGKAYLRIDKKALAVESFQKALEFNPNSNDEEKKAYDEGVKKLKELQGKK